MANINDDEREGYINYNGTIVRNCSSISSGIHES